SRSSSHVAAASQPYTLSLHDALPISASMAWLVAAESIGSTTATFSTPAARTMTARSTGRRSRPWASCAEAGWGWPPDRAVVPLRSEEHTSELQSRENLVCRLLLEKKK